MSNAQRLKQNFKLERVIFLMVTYSAICFSQTTWESISWTRFQGVGLNSVTYGNGLFLAVGKGGKILTSTDGKDWVLQSSLYPLNDSNSWFDSTASLTCVAGNNKFVILEEAAGFYTSTNGTTWMKNPISTPCSHTVTFCNGQFLIPGEGYCGRLGINTPPREPLIISSPDAAKWSSYDVIGYGPLEGNIAYGNSVYVGLWHNYPMTSADCKTWNYGTLSLSQNLASVAFGNGQFVIVGGSAEYSPNSGIIWTSSNGTNWSIANVGAVSILHSVCYGNSQFVAVGDNGTILNSLDGITWTKRNPTIESLYSVCFGNGMFEAVGNGGVILASKADNSDAVAQNNAHTPNINGIKVTLLNNCISAIVPHFSNGSVVKTELFTVNGKRLYSAVKRLHNGALNIPSLGLPAGKYFLSVSDGSNHTASSSVMLNK